MAKLQNPSKVEGSANISYEKKSKKELEIFLMQISKLLWE